MKDGVFELILAILSLVFLIALISCGPLAVIWALNTLGCNIPYNFVTWFAALVLLMFFGRNNPGANTESK